MPSVRGRTRPIVATGLITSATSAGALAGLVAFLVASPLRLLIGSRPDLLAPLVVALVGAGVLLDGLHLGASRPRPPAVGRQVPQEWTRLLDPRIVALVFGARLGVGPLTILSTWGWWSAMTASAVLGPAPAVLVGATFGFVRLVVTVSVSLLVERRDRARFFIRLRSGQGTGWATLTGAGLVAVVSVAVAGCASTAARPELVDELSPANPLAVGTSGQLGASVEAAPPSTQSSTPSSTQSSTPPSTVPADLEDFVRAPSALSTATTAPTPNELAGAVGTAAITPGADPSSEPAALAAALPAEIDGFEVIAASGADRHLDLRAAAELQPDPTEEIALLETRGFRGGWTRAFRNRSNDVAVVSVYQFETAAEAEFYLEDGLITIGGYGGSFFDIEGLPGVRGFAQTFADGDEELISLGASFQAGPRWFLVYLVGSPDTVTPATLIPVVASQRERQLTAVSSG